MSPKGQRDNDTFSAPTFSATASPPATTPATISALSPQPDAKVGRLFTAGFALSRNDRKIILDGQLAFAPLKIACTKVKSKGGEDVRGG